jgi:hypothetical protein
MRQAVFRKSGVERRLAYSSAQFKDLLKRNLLAFPLPYEFAEVLRKLLSRPAHMNTTRSRGGYALRLTFPDVVAFAVRREAEDLEHDVGDKRSYQVLAIPSVKQGHIEHGNVYAAFLGEDAPLLLNFVIVAPEPVYAVYESKSPGLSRFSNALYWGLSKSLPLCLSVKMRSDGIFSSLIAISCLSSFWSALDTHT